MIVTSTTARVPFTPSWLEGVDSPPVFQLRSASVIERGQMEAELAGPLRAGKVWDFELRQAYRDGVIALLGDDPEIDQIVGLAEAEAEAGRSKTKLPDDEQRLLDGTRDVLAQHWPDYRDLVAQLERRRQVAPIVALQRFCVGWDNVKTLDGDEIVFARGRDGLVAEAALSAIPELLMMAAGNRAYGLQFASGEAGNSSRPRSSDSGPTTSSSDDGSTADGNSPASGGKKTPASRSQAEIWPVVDLYFLTRRFSSPFGGQPLPCPGSPGEQPAALIDAFALLDAAEKPDG